MEVMKVYNEAMATWIIARVTSGKCEGAAFVFGLIESAIRKEATEILLTPIQELDMVRMDFGRLHCYYRQPDITRAPVCGLGNLSCPHWQCCRGRSTHRKTIPWIGRRAL